MRRFILAVTLSLSASFAYSQPQFERIEIDPVARARTERERERERDPEYQKSLEAVRCAFGMCKATPLRPYRPGRLVPPENIWDTPSRGKNRLIDLPEDSPFRRRLTSSLSQSLHLDNEIIAAMVRRVMVDADLQTLNRDHPEIRSLRIEYDPVGPNRYRVYDGQLLPVYEAKDVGEIVARACDELDQGKSSVVIGFEGFSEKDKRAFATEFSVQSELHSGKAEAWSPTVTTDRDLLALYRAEGMKLEGVIVDKPMPQWWRVRSRFTNGVRNLWVQTWLTGSQYMKEFTAFLFRSESTNSSQSAEQAVERSRRQLLTNHPELSERQIFLGIRQEIRQSHLGEVLRRKREAA